MWQKVKIINDEIVIKNVKKLPLVCFWMIKNLKLKNFKNK